MSEVDVLIIGAGPAGCAAAIEAARGGARVLVLDRARFPRNKTCGDAVSAKGAALIDILGGVSQALTTVPHAIVHAGVAILPDGSRLGRGFGHEPGYIVARLVLDDLLRSYLERSSATLRQGVAVRELLVEGGRVVGAASDSEQWRAPITIAADGPGSLAWAALGQSYERGPALALAITGYYEGVEFGADMGCSEHYFEPDLPCGYGWAFPPVEGQANVGVYQRADHFARNPRSLPELLERFLAAHPERFAKAERVGRARVWSLPLSVSRQPRGGPGLLACGDAGRFIDPLSGEGIWQALHSGRLAAEQAIEGLARVGTIDASCVRAYERACARDIVWPARMRLGIQEGMRVLVSSGGYRRPLVRRALSWGYGGDLLHTGVDARGS